MTKLLRKIFIRDYNNLKDEKVREKHGFLASFVGIFSNLILFGFKLATGIITSSLSITSDAINNLSDMSSGLVNVIGFKIASKPADKDHPFGHQRIEYIAGLIVSFIIIALAIVLGYTSIQKIIYKENTTSYDVITFVVLGVAILIKLWQGFFYKKMSKLINSVSLKAASQDAFNDVISTSAVLLAAILQFLLSKYVPQSKPYLYLIDGITGTVVALLITITGIKLIIETSSPLIGTTADKKIISEIVKDIKSYSGVLGIHDLVTHCYGPTNFFMTIHVEVDSKVDVMVSHELIDKIENEITDKYKIHITIHMDPVLLNSPELSLLKTQIESFIKEYSPNPISFHDLRIVKGPSTTNVLFDVVIPYDLAINEEEFISFLKSKISTLKNSRYKAIIKVDRVY